MTRMLNYIRIIYQSSRRRLNSITAALKAREPTWSEFAELLTNIAGSYVGGVVEFKVPFQQYLLKHCLHISGGVVLVLPKLLDRIAHPTHAGHSESRVLLALV